MHSIVDKIWYVFILTLPFIATPPFITPHCSLLLVAFPTTMLISNPLPRFYAELARFLNVWAFMLFAVISLGFVFQTYFKWHNCVNYFQRFPCFNILQDHKYNHVHQILFRLFVQGCSWYFWGLEIWPNPIFLWWQMFELFFGGLRNFLSHT